MQLQTRPYNPAIDEGFVFSTFLRGVYYGNDTYTQMDQESYFKAYQSVLRNLLQKPGTEVRIACLPDDADVAIGYSISTGPVLHFVFVKEAFRKAGVASQLVSPSTHTVTHITKPGNAIRKKRRWAFNPFLL